MPSPGVTIVSNFLGELAAAFPDRAADAVGETAHDTAQAIQSRITAVGAVASGHMRDTTKEEHQVGAHEADVTTEAEYWVHVNYGTEDGEGNVRMAARPFVEPVADVMQSVLEERVADGLQP